MKQVTQNYKTGDLGIVLVPTPAVRPGGVIVRNVASLISAGTEKTKVDTAKMSLLAKARSRPDQVKKVLQTLKKEGYMSTYRKVMGKLDALSPLGYSSSGIVMEVGPGVTEFRVGDRVACAGAGYANHAEAVYIPKNLCAKVPDNVDFAQACYATVGAIALQGVRQADLRLGERVAVIGLGLLGQITIQLLKASGCYVLGIDIDAYSTELAKTCGADMVGIRGQDDVVGLAVQLSKGAGLDAVIITAGTKSNDPIELAPELLKDKGRVVVVGAVNMNIPREPYFQKEIDLRLSRSYGPGRYDVKYEEKGHDYPFGYVRWTEQRNIEEFLNQIAAGSIDPSKLTTHQFPFEEVQKAYSLISGERAERYVGIVLNYAQDHPLERAVRLKAPSTPGRLGVGMIGAGSFAKSTILPCLKATKGVALRGLHTATGLTATDVGNKFGFAFASGSASDVITDKDTHVIFITTRHNTHAELTVEALRAGKAVFVEKPLAITEHELRQVVAVWEECSQPLLVGFNRRFAPMVQDAKRFFAKVEANLAIQIRVNAGAIPADHWVQDLEEGGGRIIGEVCHFIDLAQYLAGSPITKVYADAMVDAASGKVQHDIVNISLRHKNGAISSINYFANGDTTFSKERIEIFGGGAIAIIDDFMSATWIQQGKSTSQKLINQDKGHKSEIDRFLNAIENQGEVPIPFEEIVNSSLATLKVVESLRCGGAVEVSSRT